MRHSIVGNRRMEKRDVFAAQWRMVLPYFRFVRHRQEFVTTIRA